MNENDDSIDRNDDRIDSPLAGRLRTMTQAHTAGAVATDELWHTIERDGSRRRTRDRSMRTTVVAMLAAAAVLAAVFVVRINASDPTPKDDTVTVATMPATASSATNQAVTTLTKAGLTLAFELEVEAMLSVARITPGASPDTDAQMVAQRTKTDEAVSRWTDAIDQSPLPASNQTVEDAAKQMKNRLGQLPALRQQASEALLGSAATLGTAYADQFSDVLSVGREARRSSSSVTQWRELMKLEALTMISSATARIAMSGSTELSSFGGPVGNPGFAAVLEQEVVIDRAFETYADLDIGLRSRDNDISNAAVEQWILLKAELHDNHEDSPLQPIDASEWFDAGLAQVADYHRLEGELVDGIPALPAPDHAAMRADVRVAIGATAALAQALDDESLASSWWRVSGMVERDELDAARDATDRAIQAWRDAMQRPGLPTDDAWLDEEKRRVSTRIDTLGTIRISSDQQQTSPAENGAQYFSFASDVHSVHLRLAWHAGSVPELVRQLTAQRAGDQASAVVALTATVLGAWTDGVGRSLTGDEQLQLERAHNELKQIENQFDGDASNQHKQWKREADRAALNVDQAITEAASREPVALSPQLVFASAREWVTGLHDAQDKILAESIDPNASVTFGNVERTVGPSATTSPTTPG